ncbi:MAG: PTS fructose-like transporter subunit IIB [Firmicutes bacterium]|nr:PTS fructose-like transporter subunit IIB [Bacillota bacterium]
MKVLAVTACPTGVVNTYMAAEALKRACEKFGLEIKVETQGSIGIENKITKDDILDADAVILTKDIPIKNKERFNDLPIIKVSVSDAIKKAESIIIKVKK